MHRSLRGALVALLVSCVASLPAEAQRPLWIGVAGGASVPLGTLGDATSTGWHALGVVGLASPIQPMGLRLDVAYNRLDATGAAGQQTIGSGTLNLSYRFPSAGMSIAPYAITGLGAYRVDCSGGATCGADTRFGWNAGLGTRLRLLGFGSFVEARYHRTKGTSFVPVTFGLTF
jgi:hypothetical protein